MIKIIDLNSKTNSEIIEFLSKKINVHNLGTQILTDKIKSYNIFIDEISNQAANILKQDMLSIGGDIAVHTDVVLYKPGINSCLIIGTKKQIKKLIEKMKTQPFGLKNIALDIEKKISNYENFEKNSSNKNHTKIMGILNLTEDSFFDGGKYSSIEKILNQIENMIDNGVDIIDIGAESTRQNSNPTSSDQEIKKILPVLELIKKIDPEHKIPISIDTYRADVAEACLHCGADIINDISACTFDKKMPEIIKKYNSKIVLMHIKGTPKNMQINPTYNNLINEIMSFLEERINFMLNLGIEKNNIIIDPGIGFGKTTEHNLEILKNINIFKNLGYPILVGASRKSFIGSTLNEQVENRLIGTLAVTSFLAMNKIEYIRVHDIKENKQTVEMIKNIF